MRAEHWFMIAAVWILLGLAARMIAAIIRENRRDDIDDLIEWENQWNR